MNTKIITTGSTSLWMIEVIDDGDLIHRDRGEPNASMNECAYIGAIQAFDYIQKHAGNYTVVIENELVREQIRGIWTCLAENLIPYRNKAQKMYQELKDRVRISSGIKRKAA